MDKKNIIIVILSVGCLVLGYLVFKPTHYEENSFIKARIDSIAVQNKTLLATANKVLQANSVLKAANDSLSKLPAKIKTKYVSVYKQLDKLDKHEIADTLNSIFVKNNIDTAINDTMILLSPLETKFLIKEHYKNGELSELDTVCQQINKNLNAEVKNDSAVVSKYQEVVKNQEEEIYLGNKQILNLQDNLRSKDRTILRQKVFKWIGAVAGSIAIGYLTIQNLKRSP